MDFILNAIKGFDITWIFTILSLSGNYFVIKKNVLGQWIWAASNIGWVVYFLRSGQSSPATLFAVYFCLCVWGIVAWTRGSKTEAQTEKVAVEE